MLADDDGESQEDAEERKEEPAGGQRSHPGASRLELAAARAHRIRQGEAVAVAVADAARVDPRSVAEGREVGLRVDGETTRARRRAADAMRSILGATPDRTAASGESSGDGSPQGQAVTEENARTPASTANPSRSEEALPADRSAAESTPQAQLRRIMDEREREQEELRLSERAWEESHNRSIGEFDYGISTDEDAGPAAEESSDAASTESASSSFDSSSAQGT